MKPATVSRRGFLRALGLTTCTVLLGDIPRVVAAPPKVLDVDWVRFVRLHGSPTMYSEVRYRIDDGDWKMQLGGEVLKIAVDDRVLTMTPSAMTAVNNGHRQSEVHIAGWSFFQDDET